MIGGCAFGDYDGDGRPDLYVTNSIPHWGKPNRKDCGRLYRNLGGGRFEDVTERAGIHACGLGMGAFWADLDGDGRLDLYLTNVGRQRRLLEPRRRHLRRRPRHRPRGPALLRRGGLSRLRRRREARRRRRQLPRLEPRSGRPPSRSSSCESPRTTSGQPSQLFRNEGGRRFRDVTQEAGLAVDPRETKTLGVAVLDYDGDGRPDLYFVNDRARNRLFRNLGDGRFEETTAETGAGVLGDRRARGHGRRGRRSRSGPGSRASSSRTSAPSRTASTGTSKATLFEDAGAETRRRRRSACRSCDGARTSPTSTTTDWPDLYAVGGHLAPRAVRLLGHYKSGVAKYVEAGDSRYAQPTVLLHNRGGALRARGRAPATSPEVRMVGRGSAVADVDGDGALDLFVVDLDGRVAALPQPDRSARETWLVDRAAPRRRRPVRARHEGARHGGRPDANAVVLTCRRRTPPGALVPLHFGLGDAEQRRRSRDHVAGRRETDLPRPAGAPRVPTREGRRSDPGVVKPPRGGPTRRV